MKGAATVKKLLLLAIGLLILGAAAIGFGVYSLSDVGRLEGYAADDRVKAVAEEAKEAQEATSTGVEPAEPGLSLTYHRSADSYLVEAEDLRIVGWSFIWGAVVPVGAGVLVLFARRRRVSGMAPIRMLKQLVIGVTLVVLGLTAGGFGVATFVMAAENQALADRFLNQAEEALDRAVTAPPDQRDAELREADFRTADAALWTDLAEQRALEAWLLTAGAVVLGGAGVLVLLARRRRVARVTADPEATLVIQRI